MKFPRYLLGLVVIGLAAAGCGNGTSGGTNGSTPGTTTDPAPVTSAAPAADPLARIDPCSLLDPATITQNQLAQGKAAPAPGARTCSWDNNASASSSGYTVEVSIYDQAGVDQLDTNDFTVTDHPVGKHQGKLSKDNAGHTCAVSIAVTRTSRVDVVGIDGAGQLDRACVVATTVAPSVEQKLPVGGN